MSNFDPAALPAPLQLYFTRTVPDEAATLFAPDAAVRDEGEWHHGRAAIAQWLRRVEERYHPRYRVQQVATDKATPSLPSKSLAHSREALRFYARLSRSAPTSASAAWKPCDCLNLEQFRVRAVSGVNLPAKTGTNGDRNGPESQIRLCSLPLVGDERGQTHKPALFLRQVGGNPFTLVKIG
ncbi:hypothetical protein [Devosia sp. Naph2]|uniref:hypothetical protein n=1 Tax=Devosia polycyclovorans TaxID=3345148 RepID=UPI0035CE9CCC